MMEADKCADPEVQFEVDIMVLDYLLCNAINAILQARVAERKGEEHTWDVNGFLELFYTFKSISSVRHSEYDSSNDMEAKLQLLTFTTLFFQRYVNSVWCSNTAEHKLWRQQRNGQNVMEGHRVTESSPWAVRESSEVDSSILDLNYQTMLLHLKISPMDRSHDRKTLLPLLNIIPEFLTLCTIAAPILSEELSLDLAAQFMTQATLEQGQIFGNISPEVINEAFTWGPWDTNTGSMWQRKRVEHMKRLQPPADASIYSHLQTTSSNFSVFQFEGMMIDFLVGLIGKLEVPVLLQLERGQLRGLSREETEDLKERAGF